MSNEKQIVKEVVTVYVVMGNDFPDSVFSRAEDAESYCIRKRSTAKRGHVMIRWRKFGFVLDGELGR